MQRNTYNLSHFSLVPGDIGRLQSMSSIPVVAGDSIQLSYDAVIRLAALRRDLTLDAQVDIFAFFIPYRQIYGSAWTDFLLQGIDEGITFTNGATGGAVEEQYFGFRAKQGQVYPLWVVAGYNRIWNRYFRVPTDLANVRSDSYLETSERGLQYGSLSARLKVPWSTGIDETTAAADREVTISASKLDILDLVEIQKRYKSETERDFFAQRYTDILKKVYGGSATVEADQRPHLLMRSTTMLSGYDVDGTDDASLGSFSGKSAGQVAMRMPPKFFSEHGTLWVQMLVRFPTIFTRERHYLTQKNNPGYLEISGDPDIWAAEEPQQISADDWFTDGASNDLGNGPYGQWYRHHPNYVHLKVQELQGFPFAVTTPTTKDTARYYTNAELDPAFQSTQLGHWNAKARLTVSAKRVVPAAAVSIYAGT